MLTEAEKATLVNNLETEVDWRYPTASGADQYDFNANGNIFTFREKEPVSKEYPAAKIKFLPRMNLVVGGMNNFWYTDDDGWPVYGHGELEPIIITVYTHQQCAGTTNIYHGKIVADTYIRNTERHIRRYWPKILWDMDAKIKENISFVVEDISEFIQGTEKQGFEMTMYVVSTNTWDHKPDGAGAINTIADASLSVTGDTYYDFSISGMMTR